MSSKVPGVFSDVEPKANNKALWYDPDIEEMYRNGKCWKEEAINQSDKHSLYEWAAWEEIIMEIYNEELKKGRKKKKTWYSWDQSIYLKASNQSVKSK